MCERKNEWTDAVYQIYFTAECSLLLQPECESSAMCNYSSSSLSDDHHTSSCTFPLFGRERIIEQQIEEGVQQDGKVGRKLNPE